MSVGGHLSALYCFCVTKATTDEHTDNRKPEGKKKEKEKHHILQETEAHLVNLLLAFIVCVLLCMWKWDYRARP